MRPTSAVPAQPSERDHYPAVAHAFDAVLSGAWNETGEAFARLMDRVGHPASVLRGLLILTSLGAIPSDASAADAALVLSRDLYHAVRVPPRPSPIPHSAVVVPILTVGVWWEARRRAAEVARDRRVLVATVEPLHQPEEMRARYVLALGDLALARTLRYPPQVIDQTALALPRMLAGVDEVQRQELLAPIRGVLGLDEPDRSRFLETLAVWFLCARNSEAAAAALTVHPNTIRYRLDRVEELLPPELEIDSFPVELAVRLSELHRTAAELPRKPLRQRKARSAADAPPKPKPHRRRGARRGARG